jgi:rod shape-determining protein MreC
MPRDPPCRPLVDRGAPIKLIFTQGPSITVRLIVCVALSIGLMMMDHRQSHLESFRAALSIVVYPIQLAVGLPGSVSGWFRESLATRRQLQEENVSLQTQLLMLKAQRQKLEALEVENIRLRELLDSSFEVGEKILVAELMSVNLDPYKHQIADGVMGQVVHVGPYTSTAVLITDTSHAIPVQVNRNGLRSIALGSGTINRLELPYLPNNSDILIGDLLITSGLGGRFPPGYPVAIVTAIQQDPGQAFARIVATPKAKLDRSREVLLVWPGDIDAALAANAEAQSMDADIQVVAEDATEESAADSEGTIE